MEGRDCIAKQMQAEAFVRHNQLTPMGFSNICTQAALNTAAARAAISETERRTGRLCDGRHAGRCRHTSFKSSVILVGARVALDAAAARTVKSWTERRAGWLYQKGHAGRCTRNKS